MNQEDAIARLLMALTGNDPAQGQTMTAPQKARKPPWWARRNPANLSQLWRQLSANAGRPFMPGGYVGAVRKNEWEPGIGQKPKPQGDPTLLGDPTIPPGYTGSRPSPGYELNPNDMDYGETGGEATFFTQAMGGGMTPLSASAFNLGVPYGWNPFRKKKKKGNK